MPFPQNTPSIDQLINLPAGEIAQLPVELLAALRAELDLAAKQLKSATARLSTALEVRYRRRGPSLLVAEGRLNSKGRAVASRSKTGRGLATVPIFLLVPQVRLRKRLDLARDAERARDAVPGLIVTNWVDAR